MRVHPGLLSAIALAAISCGTSDPAPPSRTVAARSAVSPQELYCGEVDCYWAYRSGACGTFATLKGLSGAPFVEVRMTDEAGLTLGEHTVTLGADTFWADLHEGGTFDWTAPRPVSFVVASAPPSLSGSPDSNIYVYVPPSTGDSSLSAYEGRQPTQILFCLSDTTPPPAPVLTVTAEAHAGFTRTWGWGVLKSAPVTTVTADVGATVDVQYTVTVSAEPFDAGYVATGAVAVHNSGTAAATGVAIAAALDRTSITPVALDCGPFAGILPAGATLTCTWTVPMSAPESGTLLVRVTANGNPPPISISSVGAGLVSAASIMVTTAAPFSFGGPSTTVDGCVTVTDDRAGALGDVCAPEVPRTFTYTRAVGPYACEPSPDGYAYSNTARVAVPSGTAAYSTWTVQVRVPCTAAGCTLTQGYWKTHSREGPAPYDARWKNLGPLEEDTPFFGSGQTWLQVFATPVRGSAYYALAHQYMAAKLNVLAGASAVALGNGLATAEAFFSASTPATRLSAAQKAQLLALADLLDRFNSGTIGPGHCAEATDCTDGNGVTCPERCAAKKGHDDALHQQCLERKAAQSPKLQGVGALCVQPQPVPDLDERCDQHEALDQRIQVCVDECLWAYCVNR